jgi:hypothetical protein
MEVGVGYPGQDPIRMFSFSDTFTALNLPMVSFDLAIKKTQLLIGSWFCSKALASG